MNIPNLEDLQFIDTSTGRLTAEGKALFGQLFRELKQKASDEGLFVPQQSTATITALNTQQSTGAFLYDSDTNELKVNINGTFKVVQTI